KNFVTTVLKGQAQTSPKENAKPSLNNSEPKKKQGEVPDTSKKLNPKEALPKDKANPLGGSGKLDLNTIRAQVSKEKEAEKNVEKAVSSPLEEESLMEIWNQHIEELKKNDKKQAANLLNMATVN